LSGEQPDSRGAKERAKAEKKRAKAEMKAAKKRPAAGGAEGTSGAVTPVPVSPGMVSPAERSARAAETQVKLQRWRILFALLGFAVALATLAWMIFFR